MAVETVFLFVLVVALAIGNALLSFIPSNGAQKMIGQDTIIAQENAGSHVFRKSELAKEQMQTEVLFSNFSALNQKINLTSKQLDILNEKIKKLENFKANTGVEITALKEILLELQKKYVVASSKTKNSFEKKDDLTGTQMHKIIYRSRR